MALEERARAAFPFAPLELLGRAVDGVVSWNVGDTCNYRCSYCTQRFMPERSARLEDPERYLAAFRALPGCWEVKLSGGEPFQQPGIVELAAGLVAAGHVVSVQTNFSAADALLEAFLAATRGALHVFSASLHLEYTTAAALIARYEAIVRPYEAHGLRFSVTSVGVPERLAALQGEVAPTLAAAGIALKVQPEKVRGRVRAYTAAEEAILLALGGHNRTGTLAADHQGRLCYAGARYLVIKSDGQVYRCYPAYRVGGRYARLGAFTEGIALGGGPRLCPYTYCNCTVPIHRGMIQGVARTLGAAGRTED